MRVGIICEGSTDYAVLERLVKELAREPQLVISPLQPNFDALRQGRMSQGTGWQAVRKYLRSPAFPVTVASYDVIVVHVDADVRDEPEIRGHLSLDDAEGDELSALCTHIKSWMAGGVPSSAIITIPREATEAWLLAAHTRRKNVESIEAPARSLADAGLLATTERGLEKSPVRYAELAEALVRVLGDARTLRQLPELGRFLGKAREAFHRLKKTRTSKHEPQ